jgi:hypothetical protein
MNMLLMIAAVVQDTAGKVAYVPKPGGPPDSSFYMWLGYGIAFATFGGYIALLLRRIARARNGSGA